MEATLVMKELEPCAEGAQAAHGGTRERMGEACLALAGTLSAALGLAPVTAHAAVDVSGTLSNVLNMLANGIILLGGYLTWVLGLPFEEVSILIYASTIPLWALGFWEPKGMRPERWLPLWLRHRGPASRLTYSNGERHRMAFDEERRPHVTSKAYQAFARRQRGIELWEFGDHAEG